MTTHPLAPLAGRVGCNVDELIARIAASEHLCNVIADALTRKAIDANGERTITPPTPIGPLPVKLTIDKSFVEARYPEPERAMIDTVKALGWQWNAAARVWAYHVDAFSGPAVDRLVEAACALLNKGFIVTVPGDDIAARVAAGNYTTRQDRWITKVVSGEYAGRFSIRWGRGDDFYHAAHRIHGAKYAKPYIVAPAESYDEVLDFAQEYGFSVSEGAQKLADEARQRAWAADVVQPPPLHKRERVRTKRYEKPRLLADVNVEGIDDELTDRD